MTPLPSNRSCLAVFALLVGALVVGCPAPDDETAGGVPLGDLGAYAVASSTGLVSADPPPPAPASVVDPDDPWKSLGPLTGGYRLDVERLDHDCRFGPDVPLSVHERAWPSAPITTTWKTEESFHVDLVQRGDTVVFELGEGVVRATWNQIDGALEHVERVGADGTTRYVDGFEVRLGATGFVIAGESDWLFDDVFYARGESCAGRTRWRAEQTTRRPVSRRDDFQIVLRWPSSSDADLDLMVRPPHASRDDRADPVGVERGCYALQATGRTAASLPTAWDEFIADVTETVLPVHEEVIRCSVAAWGEWRFDVMNWSLREGVEFEIETFWGPGVNTGGSGERSFGTITRSVSPLSVQTTWFELSPPPPSSPGSTAGGIITIVGGSVRLLAEREFGPWTGTLLESRKAAFEGLDFDDFIHRVAAGP